MKNSNYIAITLLATSFVGCSSIPKGQYEDIGYYDHGNIEDVYIKERGAKIYPDMIVSEIVSVYDGDTIRVNLTSPKGLPDIISKNIPIRLDGIDTPEIRGSSRRLTKLAKEARDFAEERLKAGNIIILKRLQRGKYFRIIAEVEIDGINLNQELIEEGLARPYFGGSKIGIWDNRFRINRKRLERERKEETQKREETQRIQEDLEKREMRKEKVRERVREILRKRRERNSLENKGASVNTFNFPEKITTLDVWSGVKQFIMNFEPEGLAEAMQEDYIRRNSELKEKQAKKKQKEYADKYDFIMIDGNNLSVVGEEEAE